MEERGLVTAGGAELTNTWPVPGAANTTVIERQVSGADTMNRAEPEPHEKVSPCLL